MAYRFMARIVMAYIATADIFMAHIVMAYIVMVYIVVAYLVMAMFASDRHLSHSSSGWRAPVISVIRRLRSAPALKTLSPGP